MSKMNPRGCLIVLEGIDRSGKTTTSRRLAQEIPNSSLFCFPDRSTPIGKIINSYLKGELELTPKQIHRYFAWNRHEVCDRMIKELEAGKTVLVDRYVMSGFVYSGVQGVFFNLNYEKGLIKPDLTLYLRVSPDVACLRGGFGSEVNDKLDFQKKVEESFNRAIDQVRFTKSSAVIDASQTIEHVLEQCHKAISELELEELEYF